MEELHVTITCPHCGFSRTVRKNAIPPGSMSATCPKCREAFAFSAVDAIGEELQAREAGGAPLPPATPLPGTASVSLSETAAARPEGPRTLAFSFQGNGGEYFGIWIVNTFLKIITLGFYSAWAKVRKRRYLYGSTTLSGEPFEYLADPLALFKGWIIGAVAFLLYMIANRLSPSISMFVGLAIFVAVPWLVVRSHMFNARNSSHRNIRFSFRPNYEESYLIYAGLALLVPFSLGLLIPYVTYRQKKFLVENSSYGMTPFAFDTTVKEFYFLFLRVTAGAVALLVILSILFFVVIGGNTGIGAAIATKSQKVVWDSIVFFILFFLLFYFYSVTYVQTELANLTWNGTSIGDCRFKSSLRTRDMVWLYLSNAVAITCTLGLLIPWAAVRMAKYRFERLEARTQKGVEGFLALARNEEITATGEEIGDIFGINVDFGF